VSRLRTAAVMVVVVAVMRMMHHPFEAAAINGGMPLTPSLAQCMDEGPSTACLEGINPVFGMDCLVANVCRSVQYALSLLNVYCTRSHSCQRHPQSLSASPTR
jgi:hypothetical protein